jgi:hypothetical protein
LETYHLKYILTQVLQEMKALVLFPQVRAVYLCECGTHAICDAGFWPYDTSEREGGLRMLRSVDAGMLVMWDRGFHSFDMCARCVRQRQAHFLGRVPSHVRLTPIRRLSDGSYLAYLRPSDYQRRKQGERAGPHQQDLDTLQDDDDRPLVDHAREHLGRDAEERRQNRGG